VARVHALVRPLLASPAMDRRALVGVGLVVVSAFGYGSGSILAGPIYDTGIDWLTLVGWRFAIGAALGWVWVLGSAGRRAALRSMRRRQVVVALALGALFTGNAGTYYAGLETVPAALAGVIVYTYPVMVAVLSLWFVTRLPGPRPWIAAGLGVAGTVLALGGIEPGAAPPTIGLALVIASAVIYSVWIILAARLAGERRDRLAVEGSQGGAAVGDAAVTSTLMMSATATVYFVAAAVVGRPLLPGLVPADAWPGIAAVGVVASFLAIQTFYAGSRRIGAARAALTATVEPVIIVVLAAVFLGQTLSAIQLAGAACILIGVVVAQTAPRGRGDPEPAQPLDAEA
jgi:drug/metabolite transporter (DMT)-like permease